MSFGRLMISSTGLCVPSRIRPLKRQSPGKPSSLYGLALVLLLLATTFASASNAQDELPQIDVIAKLLMLEGALGGPLQRTSEQEWVEDYLSLYKKFHRTTDADGLDGKGRPTLALALGIKISDAILAVKGRNAEGLETSLGQIEQLADKLGIAAEHLSKSQNVRQHAAEARWHDAFMYFGFLQHELIRQLSRSSETKGDAVLVLCGIWLQSGQWVTEIVLQHYSDPLSQSLKEVKMVEVLSNEVDKLPHSSKQDSVVKDLATLLSAVPAHVNAEQSGGISKKDVQWLQDHFGKLVAQTTSSGEGEIKDKANAEEQE